MFEADPQNAAMKGSVSGCFRPSTQDVFYNGEELRKTFHIKDQKFMYRGFVYFLGAFSCFCLFVLKACQSRKLPWKLL